MSKIGVVHGRFQVLHNDHLTYILAAKSRCKHLVVGITNPDPSLTREDNAAPQRSNPTANPLTYFERYTLVKETLCDAGLDYGNFAVVPFPINVPELYCYYVPLDAVFYLTIYDEWGTRKSELFRQCGLVTEVMWERPLKEKGLTSTEIRRRMMNSEPWEHLVPRAVATLIREWEVPERLRVLNDL
jgi:nicotinamide mononucleotide adenylyltransferase